ncbi:MAG: ATP-binding protein, partial [Bacteroidales bacterium]|nr:ATP-binding protein [Bacteroidales bacterium]
MQFRTKARAVDLLGKGQIADLPTAITELWKNGYDAYADTLTAELFLAGYKGLQAPVFMITDDGTGMSKDDILNKWLVLGVDSKSRSEKKDTEGEDTLWKAPRVKAGEKGIGRLSVAYLGSPMLMLTKKTGHPIQAMFFDWRLLENFNMYLDDVQIPVENITIADFRNKFELLRAEFLKNFPIEDVEESIWKDQQELKNKIIESVKELQVPDFFENEIVSKLSDINSSGTIFVIFEPEEQIVRLIKDDNKEDEVNDTEFVRTSLAGFTNSFKAKTDRLPIEYKFLIHEIDNELNPRDFFTSSGQFFESSDFGFADIIIDGSFDGNGSFNGTLKMYDKTVDYSFTNPRKKDFRNYYGTFPVKIGYSMGNEEDSYLKGNLWSVINKKVMAYGGLYIYRDGFRVLPYGRIDADFLGLEEKRSKRLGTYFFSYRRMFGYIELTRNENVSLKDKSSREGLINNGAYRAFKDDLSALFVDLAKEYFSDKAKKSIFLDDKKKLNDQNEVIKKDKARETQEKRAFTQSLKEYPKKFEEYRTEYEYVIQELGTKLSQTQVLFSDIEKLLSKIHELDTRYDTLLPTVPKRYQLTETQEDRLNDFEKQLTTFINEIKTKGESIVAQAKDKLEVKELQKDFINNCNRLLESLESIINDNLRICSEQFGNLSDELKSRCENVLADFRNQKDNCTKKILSKEDVEKQSQIIKQLYEKLLGRLKQTIIPFVEHIQRIDMDVDEDLLQGAYKLQYDNIKRQWELAKETSQLGIAVEVIDHEFNVLYSQINASLELMS